MWILSRDPESLGEAKDAECVLHGLLPGKTYVLGRAPSNDIQVSDLSVSRKHATIIVSSASVSVRDEKSAYGTYIGESAILSSSSGSQKDRVASSQEGYSIEASQTRIRFGLHSSLWILKRFNRPKILSSSLTRGEKRTLSKVLEGIFGHDDVLVDEMSEEVSYLVMREAVLTLKVASALAKSIPIVTPFYWTDFKVCLASEQVLPDPNNYIPRLNETSINSENVSLRPNVLRSTLFQGKSFYFQSEEQKSMFESTIRFAGGRAFVSKQEREGSNKIVIKSNKPGASFGSIPEAHIGLAILFNSLETYCNPSLKPKILLDSADHADNQPSPKTIVAETQFSKRETRSKNTSGITHIPPTLPSNNTISETSQSSSVRGSQKSLKLSSSQTNETQLQKRETRSKSSDLKNDSESHPKSGVSQQSLLESQSSSKLKHDRTKRKVESVSKMASQRDVFPSQPQLSESEIDKEILFVEPGQSRTSSSFKRPSSVLRRSESEDDPPKKTAKTSSYFDDDEDDLFSFASMEKKKKKTSPVTTIDASDDGEEDLFAFAPSQQGLHSNKSKRKRSLNTEEREGEKEGRKDSQLSKKMKEEVDLFEDKENDVIEVITTKAVPIKMDGFMSKSTNQFKNQKPSLEHISKDEKNVSINSDSGGFISKSINQPPNLKASSLEEGDSHTNNSVEDDLCRSYIVLEISDLIRSDLHLKPSNKSSTQYKGPNFKKFKSKGNRKNGCNEAPKRITDLCRPEELASKTQNEEISSFFEEDSVRSQRSLESEDFWNFENASGTLTSSKKKPSAKKQSTLKSFFT